MKKDSVQNAIKEPLAESTTDNEDFSRKTDYQSYNSSNNNSCAQPYQPTSTFSSVFGTHSRRASESESDTEIETDDSTTTVR